MATIHPTSPILDVPTASLHPAHWNPRTISDERFANLCRAVEADPDFLRRRPVLATADGTIYAGNMRYRAAVHLGWPSVPAILDDIPDTLAKERALRDNNQWGESEPDELAALLAELDAAGVATDLLGFADDDLAALLTSTTPSAPTGDPDAVPEPPAEPITGPGDLWLLGEHRLLCGDATITTDVERLLAGRRADMVWTDPPYGVAIGDKNKFLNAIARSNRIEENLVNDDLDEAALEALIQGAFRNALTVCRAGAVWHVAAPPGPLQVIWGAELRRLGVWRQTLQWVKNNATFSPLGVDYHWQAEPIFHGWVPGAKHPYYGDRTQTTVWEIDRPVASPEHPTMKPVELVARALTNHTRAYELVYDPFLGSGTTLIAAEQLGRRCYGLEIDPRYCDVIVRRWEAFTGREAVRDGA